LPSRKKANIGNGSKMRSYFAIFLILGVVTSSIGQKFHLRSGIGMSSINWYENQSTANFSIQLTYQKKDASVLYYGELKTLGNLIDSKVDPLKYEFIPIIGNNGQVMPTELDVNQLSAYYRGGSMELGLKMNQKKGKKNAYISPEVSLYSISLARKISTEKTHYVEEEKYALHGLSGGLGLHIPGKTKVVFRSKLFIPLLTNFTLYGRYVGVPYENSNQEINLCYRNNVEFSFKKFNVSVDYDVFNLGKSENLKSKTIPASSNKLFSVYLNYLF
jgi:hypothetical protein